jgi:hypothetical protein
VEWEILTSTALSEFSSKLLSERISLKMKSRRKFKWLHEFHKQRLTFVEGCHLYMDTRVHCDKLRDYLRMSKETLKGLSFSLAGQKETTQKAYLLSNG